MTSTYTATDTVDKSISWKIRKVVTLCSSILLHAANLEHRLLVDKSEE